MLYFRKVQTFAQGLPLLPRKDFGATLVLSLNGIDETGDDDGYLTITPAGLIVNDSRVIELIIIPRNEGFEFYLPTTNTREIDRINLAVKGPFKPVTTSRERRLAWI